ncbi:hypothetical protein B0H10DRAFT_2067938 [Mycena sp. CBHHK59/15]|nr:hypothetical protein B0H10DRAFT_2067938 [Mycena sp. CBHHK59/15]
MHSLQMCVAGLAFAAAAAALSNVQARAAAMSGGTITVTWDSTSSGMYVDIPRRLTVHAARRSPSRRRARVMRVLSTPLPPLPHPPRRPPTRPPCTPQARFSRPRSAAHALPRRRLRAPLVRRVCLP